VEPPAQLIELLERRRKARAARDFAAADALRAEIETAGWRVVDAAGESHLESPAEEAEVHPTVAAVSNRADQPDGCERTLCLAVHGWPEDARRLLAACGGAGTEVVAVDVGAAGLVPADLLPQSWPGVGVRVIRVEEPIGQADAWNICARQAAGRVLFFVEPSLEFDAGVLKQLAEVLEDEAVGLAGPFGMSTTDMRQFESDDAETVDALEYLLAICRADLGRVGEFDPHFRFYRNLDIDFSYQVRAAGLGVRRVDCGPITRHVHRLWEATPEPERERLSRRNFNRFLDHWGRS
jgi:hypothetical protein